MGMTFVATNSSRVFRATEEARNTINFNKSAEQKWMTTREYHNRRRLPDTIEHISSQKKREKTAQASRIKARERIKKAREAAASQRKTRCSKRTNATNDKRTQQKKN